MAYSDLPITLEEPGVLPPERFNQYSDASDLCQQMLNADQTRAEWRTNVQKLHDGNALYSKEALEKAGQGWRNRTNFRGMEGLVQNIGDGFYDLDMSMDKLVTVELDFGKGTERARWQDIIETNFTWLLMKKWQGFDYAVQMRTRQMVLHGLGHHINAMNDSWIPRTLPMGHLLFPDDTPLNFSEEGEFCMVRDFWTMEMLYNKVRNEAAAEAEGWNTKAVWKGMVEINKQVNGSAGTSWDVEKFQAQYKQGDAQYSNTRRAGIYLNFLYVQEFDTGKISLYVLPEGHDMGGYFFVGRNMFDTWDDVVTLFPYDIGNGTIQSIRGIGARTREFYEMENRLLNAAADQTLLMATPLMKNVGADLDKDKLRLLRLGAFSILPDGIEPAQGAAFQNVSQGLVALRNELKTGMAENNQGAMPTQPEQKDRQTFLEYSMRSQDASKLNRSRMEMYNRNRTKFFSVMVDRLVKTPTSGGLIHNRLAKAFRERCERQGLPLEALKHIDEVTATRSIGAGSAAARLQGLLLLMQHIYPVTTTDRKINIEQAIVAETMGRSNVDEFARSQEDNDLVSQDESFATIENDVLAQGGEAKAAKRQDHIMHLATHIGKGEQLAQAYMQEQIAPEQALGAITAIGKHCEEHFVEVQQMESKMPLIKELHKRWISLGKVADRIQNEVDSKQGEASPQQQMSEDGQIKMAKVQMDAEIKQKKAELDEQRKARKAQFNEALSDAKTASQIRKSQ